MNAVAHRIRVLEKYYDNQTPPLGQGVECCEIENNSGYGLSCFISFVISSKDERIVSERISASLASSFKSGSYALITKGIPSFAKSLNDLLVFLLIIFSKWFSVGFNSIVTLVDLYSVGILSHVWPLITASNSITSFYVFPNDIILLLFGYILYLFKGLISIYTKYTKIHKIYKLTHYSIYGV